MEQRRIIPLSSKATAGAAWAAYARLARELRDDPQKAADVAFCAQLARAYRDWQRLFLASEAA